MVLPSITLQLPAPGGNPDNSDSSTSGLSSGDNGGPAPFASVLKRTQDASSAPQRDQVTRRGSRADDRSGSDSVEQHDASPSSPATDTKNAISDADRKQQSKEDEENTTDSQSRDRSASQATDPGTANPQDQTTQKTPDAATSPPVVPTPVDPNAALTAVIQQASVIPQAAVIAQTPVIQPTAVASPVLTTNNPTQVAVTDAPVVADSAPQAGATATPPIVSAIPTAVVSTVATALPLGSASGIQAILAKTPAGEPPATKAAMPTTGSPVNSTQPMDSNAVQNQPASGVGIPAPAAAKAAGSEAIGVSFPSPTVPSATAQPDSSPVQAVVTSVASVPKAVGSAPIPAPAPTARIDLTEQPATSSGAGASAQTDSTAPSTQATAQSHIDGIDRLQVTHTLNVPAAAKAAVPAVVIASQKPADATASTATAGSNGRAVVQESVPAAGSDQNALPPAQTASTETPITQQSLTIDASALRSAASAASGQKAETVEAQAPLPAEKATASGRASSTVQNIAPEIAVTSGWRSETSSGGQQGASQNSDASAGQTQSAGIANTPDKGSEVSFATVSSTANASRNTDATADRARVADQVIRHLDSMRLSDDRNEMTVRLHPEELGSVKLSISSHADGVVARIVAETTHAQHAMEDAKEQLRAALEQKGMRLTSLDVSVGNGDVSDGRASNSGASAAQQDARNIRTWNRTSADASASEAISAGSGSTAPIAKDRASRLDYRA